MPRRTITYASVMSTLGVFIALGGTSYAVAKLPKNSVDSAQLKTGAVSSPKIAKGAVTADKLAASVGTVGPRGPRGAEGPAGAAGSPGPGSPVDVVVRRREQFVTFPLFTGGAGSVVDALKTTLPAGKWWLHATAILIHRGTLDNFRCNVAGSGTQAGLDAAASLGEGSASSAILTLVATADSREPFPVTIRCWHDNGPITSTSPDLPSRVERVRLTAIRASSLDVQDS